jgi:hypothetical protein
MPAALLVGPGWRARIWAAYESTHNGRPISRERMQKIVNVPVSTQRFRDSQAGVVRKQNHAKLKARADALPGLQEYGKHKALYLRKDGHIGSRKPDSRFTDLASRAGKGRARKANATLQRMQQDFGSSLMRRALSDSVSSGIAGIRLFNSTPDQRKNTQKRIARLDLQTPPDVFELSHTSKSGSSVWMEC